MRRVSDDEAREWYHRTLPGGLPRDWIQDAHGELDLRIAAVAALLSVAGRLHVDERGVGIDYGDCVICQEHRR